MPGLTPCLAEIFPLEWTDLVADSETVRKDRAARLSVETAFVGRAATVDHGSASGIYLACYFFGGLVGSAVLGQVFDLDITIIQKPKRDGALAQLEKIHLVK
jgi:hypothetical protein